MKTNKKNLSKKELKERKHRHWVIGVSIGNFFSTMLVTYISDTLLAHTGLLISFLILFAIIAFGILADIVGVAVTAVNIEPFNAMAAKKLKGAKTAVSLVRNAPRGIQCLQRCYRRYLRYCQWRYWCQHCHTASAFLSAL